MTEYSDNQAAHSFGPRGSNHEAHETSIPTEDLEAFGLEYVNGRWQQTTFRIGDFDEVRFTPPDQRGFIKVILRAKQGSRAITADPMYKEMAIRRGKRATQEQSSQTEPETGRVLSEATRDLGSSALSGVGIDDDTRPIATGEPTSVTGQHAIEAALLGEATNETEAFADRALFEVIETNAQALYRELAGYLTTAQLEQPLADVRYMATQTFEEQEQKDALIHKVQVLRGTIAEVKKRLTEADEHLQRTLTSEAIITARQRITVAEPGVQAQILRLIGQLDYLHESLQETLEASFDDLNTDMDSLVTSVKRKTPDSFEINDAFVRIEATIPVLRANAEKAVLALDRLKELTGLRESRGTISDSGMRNKTDDSPRQVMGNQWSAERLGPGKGPNPNRP